MNKIELLKGTESEIREEYRERLALGLDGHVSQLITGPDEGLWILEGTEEEPNSARR